MAIDYTLWANGKIMMAAQNFHALLSSIDSNLINSYTIESDERTGNTLLQVELGDSELIMAISTTKEWITGVVAKTINECSTKIHRLNWLAGTLEELHTEDDYLSNIQANRPQKLRPARSQPAMNLQFSA